MTLLRRLADLSGSSLSLVAPPERRVWAEAMRAELRHIPGDAEAARFAFGCVWAGARLNLSTALGWLRLGRLGLAASTAALAGGCVYLATRLLEVREAAAGETAAWLFMAAVALVMVAPLHAGAALNLAAWRPRRFALFAAAALALNLTAYAAVAGADVVGDPPVHARFYTALVAEQLGWIGVLFAATVALLILRPRLQAPGSN